MAATPPEPFNVLIAGAGVAGLEAALALQDLAGSRVAITLLDPSPDFVYRPMRVREPFAGPAAHRYALAEIARDLGLQLCSDGLKLVDPEHQIVHTEAGEELHYDALLLALGARLHAGLKHALTLDDRQLDEQLEGLIQDVEAGYVRRIAFVVPDRTAWPLPLYEIALMTARRAWDMHEAASITVITPEDAPLAVFGSNVSEAVAQLLNEAGIVTVTGATCSMTEPNALLLHPGERRLDADRVIALPELYGPAVPGVPKCGEHGFIEVDAHGRVPGVEAIFAAGDATDFYVKYGGVAAQQADVAAASIAALAGAPVELTTLNPLVHGVLLGGPRPLYMSAYIAGERGAASEVSTEPSGAPVGKISARYLAPYLEARDGASVE